MKSTLEAHTDCLLTKLEGSAGAHIRIEPTCIIITLSKTDTRILISSIAMGADYSFDVKNIEILVPPFIKHNNSSVFYSYSDALSIALQIQVTLLATLMHFV